ncbi:MAG: hypothetical protein ACREA8_04310 [Nitrosotalea sp.]
MVTKKYVVRFPSLECEQRAFEVLTGTGSKFSYIGNRNVEITQTQMNALQVQGVPYNIQK